MIGISRIIFSTIETEQIKDVKESFNSPSGLLRQLLSISELFLTLGRNFSMVRL